MSDYRYLVLAMMLCGLLFMVPVESVNNRALNVAENTKTPSDISISQILPDPELQTAPAAFVNGTSNEFTYNHTPGDMSFNWTHVAGTALDYRSSGDTVHPSFNDFVYFSQSFNWSYESVPDKAQITLSYKTTMSGSFATESHGVNMFKIYVWMVNPAGDWTRVYFSPTYPHQMSPSFNRTVGFYLSYWEIDQIWGAIFEDQNDNLENSNNCIQVLVGLAPTYDFLDYQETAPWTFYNGSVMISTSSLSLDVAMHEALDPTTHLTPLYNESYGSTIGDVYSSSTIDPTIPLSDRVFAMATDSHDNIYLTGMSLVTYETYQEYGVTQRHQTLIKYGPTLDRAWIVRNDNQTAGNAIAIQGDYIYTSGYTQYSAPKYKDMLLTKWTASGGKVWEVEWGYDYDQIGVALGVQSDGSVYVVVSDYNLYGPTAQDSYARSNLLKFNTVGTLLWNKSLPYCTYFDRSGDLEVFEDHLLYQIPGLVCYLDLNGTVLWQKVAWCATSDESGTIYAITDRAAWLELSELDSEGTSTWTKQIEIIYENGWVELLWPLDVSFTSVGEILVLFRGNHIDFTCHLQKYSRNGTLIQSWTIEDDSWPQYSEAGTIMIEAAPSGLMYLATSTSSRVMSTCISIQCYVIGEYTLPSSPDIDIMSILVVSAGVGVLALVVLVIWKKK